MSFQIYTPQFTNVLLGTFGTLLVPTFNYEPTTNSPGNLYYNSLTDTLYVSNNDGEWISIGQTSLPAPLESIANLTTSANQMLYTVSSDTYATTALAPVGRSFLSLSSVSEQQNALELIIGSTVQGYSNILTSLVSIAPVNYRIPYTSGGVYASASVTDWVLSNIFPLTSSTGARNLLDAVGYNTLSTVNSIPVISSENILTESEVRIDNNSNITGINDISIGGELVLVGNLDGITPFERQQIANINSNAISNIQWQYLSELDQGLDTGSQPTFNGMILTGNVNASSNKITNLSSPTDITDAANKSYVDSVAGGAGLTPLQSANVGSTVELDVIYSDTSGTLTPNSSTTTLTIDTVSITESDGKRIMIKNQTTQAQNGVYTRTSNVGGKWVLTRTTDFNTPTIVKGTYVLVTEGSVNISTSWLITQAVTQFTPIVAGSAVIWAQFSSPIQLVAGNGLDATGNIWNIDATARFTLSGDKLELSTVPVTYGGTGRVLEVSDTNQVLVTNGTSALSISKTAPSGNFVGTSDSQQLTNKTLTSNTNNITASSIFSNSGGNTIDISASSNPTAGQVLTATNSTTASWASPTTYTNPNNTLFVYTNASNVSPNYSTLKAALEDSVATTASATSPCVILMYPGVYNEINPLSVPQFCSITSLLANQQNVVIQATVSGNNILNLPGNTRLCGLIISGAITGGNFASDGINCTGTAQDTINNCTVRNCSGKGIIATGSGAKYSKLLAINNVSVLVTNPSVVMDVGIECLQGAVIFGDQINVSGFLVNSANVMLIGIYCHDDYSYIDLSNVSVTLIQTACVCGTATSNSQANYPILRISNFKSDYYTDKSIYGLPKSVIRLSNAIITTDTEEDYKDQYSIWIENPSLGADPNFLAGLWTNARSSKINLLAGDILNPPIVRGSNLSENENVESVSIELAGKVGIGSPIYPSELEVGTGLPFTSGETVFTYNATLNTSTDYTSDAISEANTFNAFPNTATNSAIYISAINIYTGIEIGLENAIAISSGLITSVLIWEYWNGSSWAEIPFMITLAVAPYTYENIQSFGVGTILSESTSYNYRFGNLSGWTSTLAGPASIILPAGVSDINRYYVRARLLSGASVITTQPSILYIKLLTHATKINIDGFMEYFGAGRPKRRENVPSGMWTSTGISGETAPTSIRLVPTTWATSTISSNRTNCVFANNTTTSICFVWNVANELDTSFPINIILDYSRSAGGGTSGATISFQVSYIQTVSNSVIGDPNGSPTTAGYSSGIISSASPTVSRGQGRTTISLNAPDLNSSNGVIWFKITRFGSADAFAGDIYLINVSFDYVIWCNGTYNSY